MMTYDLPRELRRVAAEDGRMACYGCGLEHDCSSYGCRICLDAADEIQVLRAMVSASDWISVEDRLPDYGVPVIVARPQPGGKYKIEQGCRHVGGWWKIYGSLVKRVTHWMHLPEPPESGGEVSNG